MAGLKYQESTESSAFRTGGLSRSPRRRAIFDGRRILGERIILTFYFPIRYYPVVFSLQLISWAWKTCQAPSNLPATLNRRRGNDEVSKTMYVRLVPVVLAGPHSV